MSDKEHREFLDAIYQRYVRAWKSIHHPEGLSHLPYVIERSENWWLSLVPHMAVWGLCRASNLQIHFPTVQPMSPDL